MGKGLVAELKGAFGAAGLLAVIYFFSLRQARKQLSSSSRPDSD